MSLRYSVVSKTKGFCQGAVPGEEFIEFGRDMAESEKRRQAISRTPATTCSTATTAPTTPGTGRIRRSVHAEQLQPCGRRAHQELHAPCRSSARARWSPRSRPRRSPRAGIDAIGLSARQNLVDPEWIIKLLEGREEEIKPCIRCHNGCFNMANCSKGTTQPAAAVAMRLHLARCALTPPTMQHNKYNDRPDDEAQDGRHRRRRHRRHGMRPGAQAPRPYAGHLRKERQSSAVMFIYCLRRCPSRRTDKQLHRVVQDRELARKAGIEVQAQHRDRPDQPGLTGQLSTRSSSATGCRAEEAPRARLR